MWSQFKAGGQEENFPAEASYLYNHNPSRAFFFFLTVWTVICKGLTRLCLEGERGSGDLKSPWQGWGPVDPSGTEGQGCRGGGVLQGPTSSGATRYRELSGGTGS